MPRFNPFDMDFDGDADGIDFLGFDYLTRRVLQRDEDEQGGDARSASCNDGEAHTEWDDCSETDDCHCVDPTRKIENLIVEGKRTVEQGTKGLLIVPIDPRAWRGTIAAEPLLLYPPPILC